MVSTLHSRSSGPGSSADSYPVAIYMFWGWEKIGCESGLRRAGGYGKGRPLITPRAPRFIRIQSPLIRKSNKQRLGTSLVRALTGVTVLCSWARYLASLTLPLFTGKPDKNAGVNLRFTCISSRGSSDTFSRFVLELSAGLIIIKPQGL